MSIVVLNHYCASLGMKISLTRNGDLITPLQHWDFYKRPKRPKSLLIFNLPASETVTRLWFQPLSTSLIFVIPSISSHRLLIYKMWSRLPLPNLWLLYYKVYSVVGRHHADINLPDNKARSASYIRQDNDSILRTINPNFHWIYVGSSSLKPKEEVRNSSEEESLPDKWPWSSICSPFTHAV